MNIYFTVYLLINTFIAGWIASEEYPFDDTKRKKFITTIGSIILIIFAIPILGIGFSYDKIIKPITTFFQFDFWFRYFFTKQLHNLKEEELAQMNALTIMYRKEDNMKNRIYKYCTELVNKRNNYIHPNQKKENE